MDVNYGDVHVLMAQLLLTVSRIEPNLIPLFRSSFLRCAGIALSRTKGRRL